MAIGIVNVVNWTAKLYYPITPELEREYYTNKRIEYDLQNGIVYIKGKDYECLLDDINTNFRHIHTLSRQELLKNEYRLEIYKDISLASEVWYENDPAIRDKVNFYYKEYPLEDMPFRYKQNLLRIVYKTSRFDMEY